MVNGCRRFREIIKSRSSQLAPTTGWICPRCNKVHAPSVLTCDRCNPAFVNLGGTP